MTGEAVQHEGGIICQEFREDRQPCACQNQIEGEILHVGAGGTVQWTRSLFAAGKTIMIVIKKWHIARNNYSRLNMPLLLP